MASSMREPTFLILVALADDERHGYGIIRQVEDLSRGRIRLGPGTLYGALDRLSDEGMVKTTRTEVLNGRLRRYYAISDAGLAAVRDEAARRSEVLTAAKARLRLALP
jgi:PadR family transcriptional regulator, regulatory protein PadR